MRARLRRWWSDVSPVQRWERERAHRATLLASIDLETADRVASELLRGEQAETPIDTSTPTAIDAYLAGFMRRHGRKQIGGEVVDDDRLVILRKLVDVEGDPGFLVAYADVEEAHASPGDLRIWRTPEPAGERAASIAHFVLDVLSTTPELDALAADPHRWRPDLARHAAPKSQTFMAGDPLALDTRSRAWARIGAPLVATMASLAVVGFLTMLLGHGRGNPWCGLPIAGGIVHVPRSLFVDGYAAEAYLCGRIARHVAGPYRT